MLYGDNQTTALVKTLCGFGGAAAIAAPPPILINQLIFIDLR